MSRNKIYSGSKMLKATNAPIYWGEYLLIHIFLYVKGRQIVVLSSSLVDTAFRRLENAVKDSGATWVAKKSSVHKWLRASGKSEDAVKRSGSYDVEQRNLRKAWYHDVLLIILVNINPAVVPSCPSWILVIVDQQNRVLDLKLVETYGLSRRQSWCHQSRNAGPKVRESSHIQEFGSVLKYARHIFSNRSFTEKY